LSYKICKKKRHRYKKLNKGINDATFFFPLTRGKKGKKRESGKKYNYFGEDELILTSFLLRFCFLTLLKV
jgi:hypothetical protein